jgi:formate dehydrogenase iron-sulfur subunit
VNSLRATAAARVSTLQGQGYNRAAIYGDTNMLGGLNVFYLLLDKPEVYGLPANPVLPQHNLVVGSIVSVATAVVLGISAIVAFRQRGVTHTSAPVEKEVLP